MKIYGGTTGGVGLPARDYTGAGIKPSDTNQQKFLKNWRGHKVVCSIAKFSLFVLYALLFEPNESTNEGTNISAIAIGPKVKGGR